MHFLFLQSLLDIVQFNTQIRPGGQEDILGRGMKQNMAHFPTVTVESQGGLCKVASGFTQIIRDLPNQHFSILGTGGNHSCERSGG